MICSRIYHLNAVFNTIFKVRPLRARYEMAMLTFWLLVAGNVTETWRVVDKEMARNQNEQLGTE